MGKENFNNEILNSFNNLLSYLPHLFDDDIAFAITNTNSYLKIQAGNTINLGLKQGDKIPEGGAISEAIRTGKVVTKDVPQHVYGVPFKSFAIPIKDERGVAVGCIVAGKSIASKDELIRVTQSVSSSLNQISVAINALSSGVQNVAEMNTDVLSKAQEAETSSKDTDGILNFIQGISAQTNMLGLNAAIEASRAGEAGKGFKVVATEIRKLSTSTSESIKRVDSVLKNISASIKSINEKVSKSNGVFQDQAATLQEIAASIEELNSMANMLESIAQKV